MTTEAITGRTVPTETAYDTGTHSPCIGVCEIDVATGWCNGCARTSEEISGWGMAAHHDKLAIWSTLADRLSALNAPRHILPWSPEGLLALAADITAHRNGHWVIEAQADNGTETCTAFTTGSTARMQAPSIKRTANALCATRSSDSDEQSLTLRSHEKLRAFAFGDPRTPYAIALVIPSGRVAFPPRTLAVQSAAAARRTRTETTLATIEQICRSTPVSFTAPQLQLPSWAAVMATFIAGTETGSGA